MTKKMETVERDRGPAPDKWGIMRKNENLDKIMVRTNRKIHTITRGEDIMVEKKDKKVKWVVLGLCPFNLVEIEPGGKPVNLGKVSTKEFVEKREQQA